MGCQYYITKSKRNCKNKALNNDLNYCTRHFNKFTSNKSENDKSDDKNESENDKSDKNKSDKNESDNDKSDDKNESDNDKSDKNKSDKNESENDKSDKNESDKNESDKNESDKNESDKNESDKNESDKNESENESDKNESENDKSENIKIKKTKKKLDENINKCIYTLKTNRVCNKKANILYKGIYYCDKHYNSIMLLKKKDIINEINIIKKTKINNNNQSTIKKKIYKILLEIHPDKCIIPNINPTELTQNLTDMLNKLKI